MSKWISGKELLERLKIKDFELFNDYVRKGLQPYDDLGRPISPLDVMERILNIKQLKEELSYHINISHDLMDADMEELRANRIIPLEKEIEECEKRLLAVKGSTWNEFKHPETEREARRIIAELVNALFRIEDVEKFEKQYGLEAKIDKPHKPVSPPRKLRPVQKHKIECRKVAERLWQKNPSKTIADLIMDDDINQIFEGKTYAENTIRNWIKDLCPDRSPGRRKKMKK